MANINVGKLIEPKSWSVLYEEHLWKPLDKLLTYYRGQDTINSCYGEYFQYVLSELSSSDESLEYIAKHIPNIQGSPLRLHLHQDKYIKQTSLSWYEGGFSYHFRGNIYTNPIPITDALTGGVVKECKIVASYILMVDDNDTFQLDIREDSKGERYYYTPEVSEPVQTSQELSLIYQFFDSIHQYIELMNDIGHYCDDYRHNAERIMLKHHHELMSLVYNSYTDGNPEYAEITSQVISMLSVLDLMTEHRKAVEISQTFDSDNEVKAMVYKFAVYDYRLNEDQTFYFKFGYSPQFVFNKHDREGFTGMEVKDDGYIHFQISEHNLQFMTPVAIAGGTLIKDLYHTIHKAIFRIITGHDPISDTFI